MLGKRFFILTIVVLCMVSLFLSQEIRAEDEPFGAEFAYIIGAQTGPFKTGTGFYMGGESSDCRFTKI